MNTSEVLDRAANLIEQRGWIRRDRGRLGIGPHCAMGGLDNVFEQSLCGVRYASGELLVGEELKAWNSAVEALARSVPNGDFLNSVHKIVHWNNNHAEDGEVIAMLRAVAATERARERAPSASTALDAPTKLAEVCRGS